jgi:hypothetical protein
MRPVGFLYSYDKALICTRYGLTKTLSRQQTKLTKGWGRSCMRRMSAKLKLTEGCPVGALDLPLPFEAYVGDQPYVFASYAHKDGRVVFPELLTLYENGIRIWYDEGIAPGNEWPESIARALHRASVFLVFISRSAVDSKNVRNEINFALNHGKAFLAVYLEEAQLPLGLELRMGDIQAMMKWRISQEHYFKKLYSAFPRGVFSQPKPGEAPLSVPQSFTVVWTSRLKEAAYSPIRGLISTGRELLCLSRGSPDFWVQAIHSRSGSLLWQIPAGDHRMVWERIAYTLSDLYLTGDVEVEPNLCFARKVDLHEGKTLVSLAWYDVPTTARQVRDAIPEWDSIPWQNVRDVQTRGADARTSKLTLSVRGGRVQIADLHKLGVYEWNTPSDDPVTAVTIQGESNPVVAFSSGRVCLLEQIQAS